MQVCELINCFYWSGGKCIWTKGTPSCPPRKAVADELVGAVEDVIKAWESLEGGNFYKPIKVEA